MAKEFEIVHPKAGGIDVGSRKFFVDAGKGVQEFFTHTDGCFELLRYLIALGVTTVAMESTGVYWTVLYGVLEEGGIDVWLTNGRHARQVPGRKSDVQDCQWLRQLHTYGLLQKSFIPGEDVRILRTIIRLRQDHIRAGATQMQLMQKPLIQMNIRLPEVLSKLNTVSGMKMVTAIVEGERDPEHLLQLCDSSLKKRKGEEILKALKGNYRDEHLFALKQAFQTWKHYNVLIEDCDKQIEIHLQKMSEGKSQLPKSEKKSKRIKNHKPKVDDLHNLLTRITDGKDPTGITGITDYGFMEIIAEVGVDMNQWPTEKHFTSWLKLAPMKKSSGKYTGIHKGRINTKAGQVFRKIVQGMLNSKHVMIGEFGKRIRARKGSFVAVKAMARKLACMYYRTMKEGVEYVEKGIEWYNSHLKEKKMKFLQKLATQNNMTLVPNPTVSGS